MQDILSRLETLNRPRLLVRTAKSAALGYRRDIHLKRHLLTSTLPRSGQALIRLMEIESVMEEMRQQKHAGYALARHIDVLAAIVGEAHLLRAAYKDHVE